MFTSVLSSSNVSISDVTAVPTSAPASGEREIEAPPSRRFYHALESSDSNSNNTTANASMSSNNSSSPSSNQSQATPTTQSAGGGNGVIFITFPGNDFTAIEAIRADATKSLCLDPDYAVTVTPALPTKIWDNATSAEIESSTSNATKVFHGRYQPSQSNESSEVRTDVFDLMTFSIDYIEKDRSTVDSTTGNPTVEKVPERALRLQFNPSIESGQLNAIDTTHKFCVKLRPDCFVKGSYTRPICVKVVKPPPPPKRTRTPLDEATDAQAVAAGVVGSPVTAMSVQRISLLGSFCSDFQESELGWMENPTRLSFGSSPVRYRLAAAIMNPIVTITIALLTWASAGVHFFLRIGEKKWTPCISRSLVNTRAMHLQFFGFAVFVQPTFSSALLVLAFGDGVGPRIAAVISLLFVVGISAWIPITLLHSHFHATFHYIDKDEKKRVHEEAMKKEAEEDDKEEEMRRSGSGEEDADTTTSTAALTVPLLADQHNDRRQNNEEQREEEDPQPPTTVQSPTTTHCGGDSFPTTETSSKHRKTNHVGEEEKKNKKKVSSTAKYYCVAIIDFWLEPNGEWEHEPLTQEALGENPSWLSRAMAEVHDFPELFDPLFMDYRYPYHWFLGCELAMSMLLSFAQAIAEVASCGFGIPILLIATGGYLVAIVGLRPHAARLDTWFTIIFAVLQFIAALVQAVYTYADKEEDWALEVVITVLSAVAMGRTLHEMAERLKRASAKIEKREEKERKEEQAQRTAFFLSLNADDIPMGVDDDDQERKAGQGSSANPFDDDFDEAPTQNVVSIKEEEDEEEQEEEPAPPPPPPPDLSFLDEMTDSYHHQGAAEEEANAAAGQREDDSCLASDCDSDDDLLLGGLLLPASSKRTKRRNNAENDTTVEGASLWTTTTAGEDDDEDLHLLQEQKALALKQAAMGTLGVRQVQQEVQPRSGKSNPEVDAATNEECSTGDAVLDQDEREELERRILLLDDDEDDGNSPSAAEEEEGQNDDDDASSIISSSASSASSTSTLGTRRKRSKAPRAPEQKKTKTTVKRIEAFSIVEQPQQQQHDDPQEGRTQEEQQPRKEDDDDNDGGVHDSPPPPPPAHSPLFDLPSPPPPPPPATAALPAFGNQNASKILFTHDDL